VLFRKTFRNKDIWGMCPTLGEGGVKVLSGGLKGHTSNILAMGGVYMRCVLFRSSSRNKGKYSILGEGGVKALRIACMTYVGFEMHLARVEWGQYTNVAANCGRKMNRAAEPFTAPTFATGAIWTVCRALSTTQIASDVSNLPKNQSTMG